MSNFKPISNYPHVLMLIRALDKLLAKLGSVPDCDIEFALLELDERLPADAAHILREVDRGQRADPTQMLGDKPSVPFGDDDDSEWREWDNARAKLIDNDAQEWRREVSFAIARTQTSLQAMLINERIK